MWISWVTNPIFFACLLKNGLRRKTCRTHLLELSQHPQHNNVTQPPCASLQVLQGLQLWTSNFKIENISHLKKASSRITTCSSGCDYLLAYTPLEDTAFSRQNTTCLCHFKIESVSHMINESSRITTLTSSCKFAFWCMQHSQDKI